MLSRRRFLAALAASAASPSLDSLARGWPAGQAPQRRHRDLPDLPPFDARAVGEVLRKRYADLNRHFVFEYYPWYGTNPWRHWNGSSRNPPSDMAASYVPRLGPYDSLDHAVLEQHARWIAESGVGAINLSWWGRGGFEDAAVHHVMDVMHDHDLKVTFHLEPYNNGRTESYASDIVYLLTEYGENRSFDCLLMLKDAEGRQGPVFKSFATLFPPQSTDCHGITSNVPLWRPDGAWRQQTDSVRDTLAHDFDHLRLLADSSALDRIRAGGFDGIAMFDSYFRPEKYAPLAKQCVGFDLIFSFSINAGFDGIVERNVDPNSCYRPPKFEPPADLDFSVAADREHARQVSEWRIDESMRSSLSIQTDNTLTDWKNGFFLTYINSFNEWHEGTAFEPMKDRASLLPEELPFGYHNPMDGQYRLEYLKQRLKPILGPA